MLQFICKHLCEQGVFLSNLSCDYVLASLLLRKDGVDEGIFMPTIVTDLHPLSTTSDVSLMEESEAEENFERYPGENLPRQSKHLV